MHEIAKVKMEKRNRNFPVSFKYTTNIALKVLVDDSWLWHQRFDHFTLTRDVEIGENGSWNWDEEKVERPQYHN
jgi:hypothetical protein